MDSFELNKIAGAVLGTALLVMALSIISEGIYHSEEPEVASYVIAVPDAPEGGAPAGGPADVPPIAVRLQTADAGAGESSARKCQACHTFDQGGAAKVGPNLYGIVMNVHAHMESFNYSAAMREKKAANEPWTYEALDAFLENPKAAIPGTLMAFAGLKRPDERANVIAYLRTLAASPEPLPEAPAAEETPAEGAAPAEGATPAEEATPPATGEAPSPSGTEASPSAPAEDAAPPTGEEAPPAVQEPAAPETGPEAPAEPAPAPAP